MAKSPKPAPKSEPENSRTKQGRFKPGQSGNPAGKKPGQISRTNRLIRDLLSDNAEAVIRSALSRIQETGDPALVKLVLDRLSPAPAHAPRDPYRLGDLDSIEACTREMQRLASAVAAGDVPEDHADEIAARIRDAAALLSSGELEARLKALEARLGVGQ